MIQYPLFLFSRNNLCTGSNNSNANIVPKQRSTVSWHAAEGGEKGP